VRSLAAPIECLFPAIRECPLEGDDSKIDLACEPIALLQASNVARLPRKG